MTQSIVIQVGQCGNQIGGQFYELALREHSQQSSQKAFSQECFFRKSDKREDSLKARAVLVDMEEGVLNNIIRSPIGSLFDSKQIISDNSGSGNNWAVGNKFYGHKYKEQILDLVRKEAEHCDYLQSFFLLFSTGGGTGSGLGSAITGFLSEEFGDVERYVLPVLPSSTDDVVTSPYNTVLALRYLNDFGDCVFPVENEALLNIDAQVEKAIPSSGRGKRKVKPESSLTSSIGTVLRKKTKPYDQMNNIVANLMLNLTSHSRYHGSLNVDLSEIAMNLVPFPRLHYLVPSLSPLYALADVHIPSRRLDQMFTEAFSSNHHLIHLTNCNAIYLACAFLARGVISISDIQRNINRIQKTMKFARWNPEGWKIGLCPVPPVGHPFSLLALKNTTAIRHNFDRIRQNFVKLYSRKAHLHHFLEVERMEMSDMQEGLSSLSDLITEYDKIGVINEATVPKRMNVLI